MTGTPIHRAAAGTVLVLSAKPREKGTEEEGDERGRDREDKRISQQISAQQVGDADEVAEREVPVSESLRAVATSE
jgi:hypothetical protein